MADQGARAAMAEQGAWDASMAEQGARAAMAEHGARAAMAEQGAWDASMAEQEAWEAMADRGAWEASMVGSPPKHFSWGSLLRGVLRRRRRSGFWGAGRNRQGLW